MLYENGGPGCSDGYWTPPVLEEPPGPRYGCIWDCIRSQQVVGTAGPGARYAAGSAGGHHPAQPDRPWPEAMTAGAGSADGGWRGSWMWEDGSQRLRDWAWSREALRDM